MSRLMRSIAIGMALPALLSACTSEQIKANTYEAIQQKDCMDRTGVPHCNPDRKGYEAYKQERDRLLTPGQ